MKKRLLLIITCGIALIPPVFADDKTGELERVGQYPGRALFCDAQKAKQVQDTQAVPVVQGSVKASVVSSAAEFDHQK